MTATLAAVLTSSCVNEVPSAMGQLRISKYCGSVPLIVVAQLSFPKTTWAEAWLPGAAALTDGHSRMMASHVVVDQRLGGAPAHAHAAAVDRARLHKQHVGSHGRDLLLRLLLRSLTHADHGDDRADSDDDAEHGEDGAQLVAGQGPHGDTNDSQ